MKEFFSDRKNIVIIVVSAIIVIALVVTAVAVKKLTGSKTEIPEDIDSVVAEEESVPETTTEAPTTTTEAPTTTTTTTVPTTTAAPATTKTASSKPSASVDSAGVVTFVTDDTYASGHTYCVGVNRQMHTVTVYGKDENNKYTKPVKAFACSCGRSGNETPAGVFEAGSDRSDWKHTWLHMVDNSWGQYTTQIKGAIWFHSVCYFTQDKGNLEYEEYNKLGGPASLGCVRLCVRDAKWIYENLAERGSIVYIYDSPVAGPLGKPEAIKIDVNSENRGWDPTDPDPANPWNG